MSHFAKIDKNNVVTEVIVSEQDFINSGKVGDTFLWIQCSYNQNFRKQYAAPGYTYDKTNEVFISPQPYPSWKLDANFDWQPPTPIPDDTETVDVETDTEETIKAIPGKRYEWNETSKSWDEML